MAQNVLSKSDCRIFNQSYLHKKSVEQPDIAFDTNSQKLKVNQNFGMDMVKNGCDQTGHGTVKWTVSQE